MWTLLVTAAFASISGFSEVNDNIYRGSRPETDDIKWLASQNIKTILTLESHEDIISSEKSDARRNGMDLINAPMPWGNNPKDAQINEILRTLQNKKLFPIFLHCKHGQDRTGLVIGLYRVEVEGWQPQDAYREMLKMKFHPQYKELDNYFRKRTGYRGN